MMKHHLLPAFFLAATLSWPLCASALTVASWTGEAGSDLYSDAGNWSEKAVPGSADTAQFSLPGELSIKLKEDASVGKVRMQEAGNQIEPDILTWHLNGKKLTLLAAAGEKVTEAPLTMTASSQAARTMIFEGGTLQLESFWQSTYIGTFPTVMIFDKGATLECSGMGYVGAYGNGEAYLLGGSKWVSNNGKGWACVLGHTEGANGLLEICGAGSSFSAKTEEGTAPLDLRTFYVSSRGSGNLRILDGGSFECDIVDMGDGTLGDGDFSLIVVDGTNSSFATGRLNVGGGSTNALNPAQPSGNALFSVSNGAAAKVGDLKVLARETPAAAGRVRIDGGTLNLGSESVKTTAEFTANSVLEFRLRAIPKEAGIHSDAELMIKGARLEISLAPSFHAVAGDKIPLLSGQTVNGTFSKLPEGAEIQAPPYTFAISYNLDGKGIVGLKVTKAVK